MLVVVIVVQCVPVFAVQVVDVIVVRDGLLVSMGVPEGHLVTDASYSDYKLVVEYRFAGEAGNCGVLVHASTPRRLYGMFPQSIECQLHSGNAGDFWCIGEDIAEKAAEEVVERIVAFAAVRAIRCGIGRGLRDGG